MHAKIYDDPANQRKNFCGSIKQVANGKKQEARSRNLIKTCTCGLIKIESRKRKRTERVSAIESKLEV